MENQKNAAIPGIYDPVSTVDPGHSDVVSATGAVAAAPNDELLLAMDESEYDEKCNEIRKANSNLIVIGKTTVDNDKEDFDNDVDDDDADNAEESEGDEFERETG